MKMEPANATGTGENNNERRLLGLGIALALLVGIGSWLAPAWLAHREKTRGILPDRARQLLPFALTDSPGRTVTQAQFDTKILVVSFLFASCSLTCPEVTKRRAEIQRLTAG